MTTRITLIEKNRLLDAAITFRHDRFLHPEIDRTMIYTNADVSFAKDFLARHQVVVDNFVFVDDQSVFDCDTALQDLSSYIRTHLMQQVIKLHALDTIDDEKLLIQDSDTWRIHPYHFFSGNHPRVLMLPNQTQMIEYEQYLNKFTGLSRLTQHCFVTEFMPILKSDWLKLKKKIEDHCKMPWLDAFKEIFMQDKMSGEYLYFSEYEILGNWLLHLRPDLAMIEQKRLSVCKDNIQKIKNRTINQRVKQDSICLQLYGDDPRLTEDDFDFMLGFSYDEN